VEIGYAPLYVVRQALPHPDDSVILAVKLLIVGVTLMPPTLGTILVATLLFLGGH